MGPRCCEFATRLPLQPLRDPVLSSRSMTSPALDLEPACPGATVEGTPSTPAAGARRAPLAGRAAAARRRSRATTWDGLAARDAVGDAVLRLGLPARLVGRLRRERPRADARRRADGRRGAEPLAIVPLMHRHEVEPSDAADPHDDAPRRRRRR